MKLILTEVEHSPSIESIAFFKAVATANKQRRVSGTWQFSTRERKSGYITGYVETKDDPYRVGRVILSPIPGKLKVSGLTELDARKKRWKLI